MKVDTGALENPDSLLRTIMHIPSLLFLQVRPINYSVWHGCSRIVLLGVSQLHLALIVPP